MRFLTNDFKDCRLIKLDPDDTRSPLVVMQEGCGPDDPACKTRMYYLQRDGQWIDEVAQSSRPESEIGDIVFDTAAEAVEVLSNLFGKPRVRQLPISEEDVQAYIAKAEKAGSGEAAVRDFLARYRAAKRRR